MGLRKKDPKSQKITTPKKEVETSLTISLVRVPSDIGYPLGQWKRKRHDKL